MHKLIKAVLILTVVSLLVAFVRESQLNQQKLELKQIEIKDTSLELKSLNEKYEQELQKSEVNQKTIDQLNKEKEELNKQLQAKKEQQAKLAQQKVGSGNVAYAAPAGNWVDQCHAWAAQAGVTLNAAAIKLLERESHCNPSARNPSSSAGGIPQALPWTKMGCSLDAAGAPCQIRWFQSYVQGRYGSFEAALAHSYAKGWY